MLSKVKSSRTVLYLIFATISLLIFTYYLLSDKSSSKLVQDNTIVKTIGNKAAEIFEEIDLETIKTVIPDAKFADIIIN
tara:strand:+ start:1527 stop:1763 length:237 start_codon:yes stop_codon:yes gene_type:complete